MPIKLGVAIDIQSIVQKQYIIIPGNAIVLNGRPIFLNGQYITIGSQ